MPWQSNSFKQNNPSVRSHAPMIPFGRSARRLPCLSTDASRDPLHALSFVFSQKVMLAVRLEGFGWSEDLALPLPPPPQRSPSSAAALLDDAEEEEEEELLRGGSALHKHPRRMSVNMRRSSSVSLPNDVDIDAEIAAAAGGAPVGTIMAAPSKASQPAPAWTTLQRQLWIKQRAGGRRGRAVDGEGAQGMDSSTVSVVVEVGLRDARQGAGEGLLRVCADVAFSACGGRRKVGWMKTVPCTWKCEGNAAERLCRRPRWYIFECSFSSSVVAFT